MTLGLGAGTILATTMPPGPCFGRIRFFRFHDGAARSLVNLYGFFRCLFRTVLLPGGTNFPLPAGHWLTSQRFRDDSRPRLGRRSAPRPWPSPPLLTLLSQCELRSAHVKVNCLTALPGPNWGRLEKCPNRLANTPARTQPACRSQRDYPANRMGARPGAGGRRFVNSTGRQSLGLMPHPRTIYRIRQSFPFAWTAEVEGAWGRRGTDLLIFSFRSGLSRSLQAL